MPRPTALKLIGERPVNAGDVDDRLVGDAFPTPPADVRDPQLAADILDILRRHNERISADVAEVRQVAATAVEGATAATARVAQAEEALHAVVAQAGQTQQVVNATGEAVVQLAASVKSKPAAEAQLRQLGAATMLLTARSLEALGQRLAAAAFFLVERLPALGSLSAAAWLWNRALPDPHPLQLVLLGLWLPVVAATFLWRR